MDKIPKTIRTFAIIDGGKTSGIFDRLLAYTIGRNETDLIQQIHYHLLINYHKKKLRDMSNRDGVQWVFKTLEQWQKEMIFMSLSTVRRTLAKLEEERLIFSTDKYNQRYGDNTKWYTINYPLLYLKIQPVAIEFKIDMNCLYSSGRQISILLKHSFVQVDQSITLDLKSLQKYFCEMFEILFLKDIEGKAIEDTRILEIIGIHKASSKQRLLDKFDNTNENTHKNQYKADSSV